MKLLIGIAMDYNFLKWLVNPWTQNSHLSPMVALHSNWRTNQTSRFTFMQYIQSSKSSSQLTHFHYKFNTLSLIRT